MTDTITLLSWKDNGIRPVHKKGFLDWLAEADPDILCLQETRAEEDQLPAKLAQPDGYRGYWNGSKRKKGYSGTGLLTRTEPLSVEYGLGIEEFDQEGRTIVATYPTFTLLNCYFPNGGRDHKRVPFKLAFYDAFLDKCERLRAQGQAVIFCGDVNTSHREIDLARRQNADMSVILFDIDFFKRINDEYGHLVGDEALQSIASCTQHCIRSSDMLFRYGGEEFLLILSYTDTDGASLLAERIRERIQFECAISNNNLKLTVSLGVTTLRPKDDASTLLHRVDKAMYQAKNAGRNQVRIAE